MTRADDLPGQVAKSLQSMGFEIQPTSLDAVTAEGEMSYLRSLPRLPACDASAILQNFPHYFVVHRSASPDSGIFFVTGLTSFRDLQGEAEKVYGMYFPKKILLVVRDATSGLVAQWHHSTTPPRKLEQVPKNISQPD
jgi:hypothetical protein